MIEITLLPSKYYTLQNEENRETAPDRPMRGDENMPKPVVLTKWKICNMDTPFARQTEKSSIFNGP